MPSAPARGNSRLATDLRAAPRETGILDRSSALRLAEDAPLPDLLAAASQLRAQGKGTVVSFSKKVFIPLTTLCRDYCGYCTFRKDPGQPGAHFMTPEEVLALAERARDAGCKEALFSLGDQPERIFPEAREFLQRQGFARTLDYAAAMSEMVLERTGLLPHANPGVMDRAALERFKESNVSVGLMLETVSTRLMRDGLAHAKAPDKALPQPGWLAELDEQRRAFREELEMRQNVVVPNEDPDWEDEGPAWPQWHAQREAILQPPKAELQPAEGVLEAARECDAELEGV